MTTFSVEVTPNLFGQELDALGVGFLLSDNSPVAGSSASILRKIEPAAPTIPLADLGGLWLDKVRWDHALGAEFDAVSAPANAPSQSPAATLLLAAQNIGSDTTVCALQTITGVHASGKEAAGVNFITYSGPGLTNVKMKGLEIDIQPDATTTITSGFGLALNAFTKEIPGNAIYVEGVVGGNFATGIRIGKLNALTGAGLYGTGTMASLIDTATGTYSAAAINVQNTHRVRFIAAVGAHVQLWVDASNFLKLTLPTNGLAIRDGADTTNLVYFDTSGNIDLQGAGTVKFASGLSSASAIAGAATLPASPVGFVTVSVGGTNRKVPYYA